MTEESSKKQTPPYPTYPSFKRLLKQFSDGGFVPDQIDQNSFEKFSGSEKAALRPALKFLGLMDDSNSGTTALDTLVEAYGKGGESWKAALKVLLEKSYADIVDGVDMGRGTAAQLDEAFRKKGGVTSGSVLPKCVRFFLQASEESGITVSPYMKAKRRAPRKPTTKKKSVKKNSKGDETAPPPPPPPPLGDGPSQGFERVPLLGGLGFIEFKSPATAQTCAVIEGAAGYLRSSLDVQKGGKK